jgi:chromosome segregation and condensation protein ScpB
MLTMHDPESYGYVPLSKLKAAIAQIEEHYQDSPERLDDVQVTFEYLIGSFFPEIVKNVHDEANKQYTLGYLAGLEVGKNNDSEGHQ